MAVYMEALVDFADVKKGDTFYAYKIPNDPSDKWIGLEGRLYYATDSIQSNDGVLLLEEGMYKEVFISLQECLEHEIKHTDKGVQDQEDFFSSLGLNSWDMCYDMPEEFEIRTKTDFFDRWYCTDTFVGNGVLSIDGERVALFSQTGRKMDCNYKWLSKESKDKALKFAKEFLKQDENDYYDVVKEGENLVNFFM